jgi:hypothetical protein
MTTKNGIKLLKIKVSFVTVTSYFSVLANKFFLTNHFYFRQHISLLCIYHTYSAVPLTPALKTWLF